MFNIRRARGRRHCIVVGFLIWLGPGAIVTYFLRNSIPWMQVQSYLAIMISLGAWFSAETPVEEED